MTGSRQDDQRFDPDETELILRRAAELEANASHSLSLTQLEQVASQASIDPAFVRRAARDVAIRPPIDLVREAGNDGLSRFVRSPTFLSTERRTPATLGEDDFSRLFDHLVSTFRHDGTMLGSAGYRNWSAKIRGLVDRNVSAKFSSGADETTIRVDEDLRNLAISISASGIIAGGGLVMLITTLYRLSRYVNSVWVGIPLTIAGMAIGLHFARQGFSWLYQKRKKELSDLADRLINLVGSST